MSLVGPLPEDPQYDSLSQLSVGPIVAPSGNFGIIAEPEKHLRIGLSAQLPVWINAPATINVRLPSAAVFDKAHQEGEDARVRFKLPPILQWFSGNIGLHHIHHLCSRIPNYRLQACLDAAPELDGVSKLVGVKFRSREDAHESRDILGSENPSPVPSVAESFGKHGNLHTESVESANGAA